MNGEFVETSTEEHPATSKEQTQTRECEFFHMVIRPMLSAGHEGELCEWLKQMGLLRQGMKCSNTNCVGGKMEWSKARVVDKYNWSCTACSKKVSIRDGSFFMPVKCELKVVIQAILNWCERTTVDVAAANLNLKTHIVKKVYEQCGDVASRYVLDHHQDWLLGGDGAVVVIDVYPDGYMTSTPPDRDGNKKKVQKKVLCIADTSCMPARIWAKIIQDQPGSPRPGVVEEAVKYVHRQVRPGSTLVANDRAMCCSYDAVKDLPGYQSVIKTIWQSAVEVCEEVQDLAKPRGNILLHEYMWRQLFGSTTSSALEYMLHHIADKYQTKEN
ncbi:hypothetical protein C0J52_21149 [Blattella germanica]|nr:hypothetical protein C0J52_21149 [Blattella germanica]